MSSFNILWPSAGWLWLALAVGLLLGGLVWLERQPWGRGLRMYLSASRWLLGVLVVLFWADPLVERITSTEHKPGLALVVDNSRSVGRFLGKGLADAQTRLFELRTGLERGGYAVEVHSGTGRDTLERLAFTGMLSDLGTLVNRAASAPRQGGIAGVVLLSDGLANAGAPLVFTLPGQAVHVLAVGDTTRRPDARLAQLRAPRQVGLGSRFLVRVDVASQALPATGAEIVLEMDGQTVGRRNVVLGGASRQASVEFLLDAGTATVTRVVKARLQPLGGEQNTANNQATAFIAVVPLQRRLLLAAASPHPDVKAIRAALQGQAQLEIVTVLPWQLEQAKGRFDLAIAHGYPAKGRALPQPLAAAIGKVPTLYVLTPETDLASFSALNGMLSVIPAGNQQDEVTGALAQNFAAFSTEPFAAPPFASWPPLSVPFGSYKLTGKSQVLLEQAVGRATTGKPLWVLGNVSGRASAIICGEGLWQWRLQEAAKTGQATVTDYLLIRTVQWLSAQAERSRFRFRPVAGSVDAGQTVAFETRLEDEAGQPVFGNAISVNLQGPGGGRKVSFVNADGASGLTIPGLLPGAYRYTATTRLGQGSFQDQGRFLIQPGDVESIDAGADFALLRQVARQSQGSFRLLSDAQTLVEALLKQKPPATLSSTTTTEQLRGQWWFVGLIALLAGAEYLVRKLRGGV